jgi:hypothetical protein
MSRRRMDVLGTRPADVAGPRAGSRSTVDGVARAGQHSGPFGIGENYGGTGSPSRQPLSPRRALTGAGGSMPSDDELLERTLAFSGSYVSDDGNVTVRRVAGAAFEYSGHRFIGHCTICARAGLLPLTGEQLSDVRAAIQFVAAHDHGDLD